MTLPLRECSRCGFVFASRDALPDLTSLYLELDDPEYTSSAHARRRQMAHLLRWALRDVPRPARLLDVGAASGILLEEALNLGFEAVGVEPSKHLAAQGRGAGLEVHEGSLPHAALSGERFDVVTIVDVIEHVDDPLGLLAQCHRHLVRGGLLLVVTPDRRSVAARILGRRWWHRRLAHVCYFDRTTLTQALTRSGFEPVRWARPRWYLPVGYLLTRVLQYAPRVTTNAGNGSTSGRVVVPFNLRDSLGLVARAS